MGKNKIEILKSISETIQLWKKYNEVRRITKSYVCPKYELKVTVWNDYENRNETAEIPLTDKIPLSDDIDWADHDEYVESDYHRAMYGRISKRHFNNDEDALESLRKWVDDIRGDGKSKYIPDKFFKGVIVL